MNFQAHDLEQERKESEQLSVELRSHMNAFGRQFDKIRDQIQLPPTTPAPPTTTTQFEQQQSSNCHDDDALQQQLNKVHALLENAKRK